MTFTQYQIVDGKKIDPWCNGKLRSLNSRARANIILPLNAKVCELISQGTWNEVVRNMPESQLKQNILITRINTFLEETQSYGMDRHVGNYVPMTHIELLDL